ncbi:MAG: hypothetical protein N4A33_02200 [Bacteriovoracaceae bacterium]|jgi:hypothetical protein|nr:hypothetical protein [Bacteriovoracaceae bacterium]
MGIILILITLITSAFANTTLMELENANQTTFKDLNIRLDLGYNSDFKETSDTEKNQGLSAEGFITYFFNKEYNSTLVLSHNKSLSGAREGNFNDSRLTFRRVPIKLTQKILLAPNTTFIIPSTEGSRKINSMYTTMQLNPAFVYIANPALSFTYVPRVFKGFYEYEVSRVGVSNVSHGITQIFNLSYAPVEKFSIAPTVIYNKRWNFNNRELIDTYITNIEATYLIDRKTNIRLGTLSAGQFLDNEQGKDSSLKLFDENTTQYYFTYSRTF